MLLCVDQDKNIKVLRIDHDSDGRSTRERVGVVPKKTFAIGEDFDSLTQEEMKELNAVIEIYKEAQNVRLKAACLAFPETMRQVAEYFESGANESERKLIFTAVMEGLRHIRRASKEE
ncbi:MAG TPA: hypothetical protein PKA55_00850 [Rhodoblastus sp.]|nr:hypothetical protein [Rhodoblastus sp.]